MATLHAGTIPITPEEERAILELDGEVLGMTRSGPNETGQVLVTVKSSDEVKEVLI